MDWQSVLKYNPNHDPRDGRFSSGAGGQADVAVGAHDNLGVVSLQDYTKRQAADNLIAPEYQGKGAFEVVNILQSKYPDVSFDKLNEAFPLMVRELATQLDRMNALHPAYVKALNGVVMGSDTTDTFTSGNLTHAWAMHEDNVILLNPKYWSLAAGMTGQKSDPEGMIQGLKDSVDQGFHPSGCDTIGSIFVHEFGHHVQNIDKQDRATNNSLLVQVLENTMNPIGKPFVLGTATISQYAKVNRQEWFAEMFGYAYSHDTPPDAGGADGQKIRDVFDLYFKDYKAFVKSTGARDHVHSSAKGDVSQEARDDHGRWTRDAAPGDVGPASKKNIKKADAVHSSARKRKDDISSSDLAAGGGLLPPQGAGSFKKVFAARSSPMKRKKRRNYGLILKSNPNHVPAGTPEGGQFAASSDYAANELPAAPGTTPIPEGDIRLYHQTSEDKLASIMKDGITLAHAQGIEGPRAIYAGTTGFYGKPGDVPTVEFHVPKDKWDAPFVLQDVPPSAMIAAHVKWHDQARYLIDEPNGIKDTLAGKFDYLLTGHPDEYSKAVEYIKRKYAQKAEKKNSGAISNPELKIILKTNQYSRILKNNKYHDDLGRFTTAQGDVQPGHGKLGTVEAMNQAMNLVGMPAFEQAVHDHLQSLGKNVVGADHAHEIERVARRILIEHAGKARKSDLQMDMDYFLSLKFDESQPRDPAGTPTGGQWRAGTGMYTDDKGNWLHGGDHTAVPKATSDRLRALAIPPASSNVHLNPDPNAPMQATWTAKNGKLQYKYSAANSADNAAEKFARLKDFNAALPALRSASLADMTRRGNTQSEKDTAAVIRLLDKTGFRVGGEGEFITRGGKAYGASTLLPEHVSITGTTINFTFPGKHAVAQDHTLTDPILAQYLNGRIAKAKGGPLFDTSEARVNSYIKRVTNNDFSAKDFRTWHGTSTALSVLKGLSLKTESDYKKARVIVGDAVAKHLGNTRAVALNSYIDPAVWKKWTRKKNHD